VTMGCAATRSSETPLRIFVKRKDDDDLHQFGDTSELWGEVNHTDCDGDWNLKVWKDDGRGHPQKVDDIHSLYHLHEKIGSGASGFVSKAFDVAERKPCAVKCIQNAVVVNYGLQQEAHIMAMLNHPNIVRLLACFEDHKRTYLVMELCEGGELLDRIINTQGLPENDVKCVMSQAFGAVEHMHGRRITHRDLKFENFLFLTQGAISSTILKTVDFGLACLFTPGVLMTKKVGTTMYMAPEVLLEKYDHGCDLWSLGILMFCLLSGKFPFNEETNEGMAAKILKCRYWFPPGRWSRVSSDAKGLIKKLIVKRPQDRFSARECLRHKWFGTHHSPVKDLRGEKGNYQGISQHTNSTSTCEDTGYRRREFAGKLHGKSGSGDDLTRCDSLEPALEDWDVVEVTDMSGGSSVVRQPPAVCSAAVARRW